MKGLVLSAAAAIAVAGGAQAQTGGSYAGQSDVPRVSGADFVTGNDSAAVADGPERLWHWIDAPEAAQAFHGPGGAPTDLSYRLWNPGEPYEFGDDDALTLGWDGTANRWHDIAASAVYGYIVEFSGGAVPEPASWGLMIAGFGAVGGAMRRRQAAKVEFVS